MIRGSGDRNGENVIEDVSRSMNILWFEGGESDISPQDQASVSKRKLQWKSFNVNKGISLWRAALASNSWGQV